jgi:hypothetical protein
MCLLSLSLHHSPLAVAAKRGAAAQERIDEMMAEEVFANAILASRC